MLLTFNLLTHYLLYKNRNPTLDEKGAWSQLHWPLYTTHSKEYLTFAVNSTAIGRGIRTKQCAFWQNYLPNLIKDVGKRIILI